MKILHIIAGSAQGGAETFCLDAIKALHEHKIEQYVICRPHPHFVAALKERGIGYHTISFRKWKMFFERRMIKSVVQDYKPDLVHCWMNRASSLVPPLKTIPVLGWFGGYYDLKNYKNCDFYMGVTRDIVRHIGEKSGRPERAFLGHTFGTLEPDAPVRREDFDLPADAKTVLLLSRMHTKKGVDTLLQAAKILPDVYLLLAGDGPELKTYQDMARYMGLSERVRFLGWRTDRAALLGVADICALPSRYEPFGTVIAEAWYAGVPLVATRADGARQYVTHGVDGLLCDIDDHETLAKNIAAIFEDAALKEALIQNGQKTYAALFSKDVVTKTLIESYGKMIAAGK